jgi:hypothetical protein
MSKVLKFCNNFLKSKLTLIHSKKYILYNLYSKSFARSLNNKNIDYSHLKEKKLKEEEQEDTSSKQNKFEYDNDKEESEDHISKQKSKKEYINFNIENK